MKIESYNVEMKSHHVEYQSVVESQMSFETFLLADNDEIGKELSCKAPQVQQPKCANEINTIGSIITHLLEMLYTRVQENLDMAKDVAANAPREEGDDIVGYSHVSCYEKYEEHQSLDFSTKAQICTDKGSLDLDLDFSMSRSFVVENRIDIYKPFDPLVINLDGDIPSLSKKSFSFDIDNDGESDQISQLAKGNGFLALDKNDNGKIDQGSELFGTIKGDGFEELKFYDEDQNNWIDENDKIFDKLRVWMKDDEGLDELVALGEVGIGAIYLNAQKSEFTYKTEQNSVLGKMKNSSIALQEGGGANLISQIDLSKHQQPKTQPLQELLQA